MTLRSILSSAAILCGLMTTPVVAQTTPAPSSQVTAPPPVPCQTNDYRQFDFWLGVWDVHQPDGTFAGTNTITSEENGCLILEQWQGASGSTGQSYNFLDPADGNWRQVWVSQGLAIDYEGGWNEAQQAMLLEGQATYHATEQTLDFRGMWTKNEDGSVTQSFEQRDAETGEWANWFTGIYTRKAQDGDEVATDAADAAE